MALVDDVALRIPAQELVELTNPDDSTAVATESTKLAQAASSIEAYFETYAEEAYDSTVAIHVEVCVRGVRDLLADWGAGDFLGSNQMWDRFKAECERVRDTRARARIEPTTNSEVTPSDENPTGGTLRPWADDRQFQGLHIRRDRVGSDPRID